MKKIKENIFFILAFVFLTVGIFFGIRLLTAYTEKNEDEKTAENYIDYLMEHASEIESFHEAKNDTDGTYADDTNVAAIDKTSYTDENSTKEENNDTAEEVVKTSSTSYIDDDGVQHIVREVYAPINDTSTYYYKDGTLWLPSYARGTLFGVLEIPSINLSRGVYTGTAEEINANYEHYLTNIGHPNMQLQNDHTFGTQIAIQGHNTTDQDLSFNRLGYVNIGEKFYILSETGVYEYVIADIYMMSRPLVEKALINYYHTFDSDKCFLTTCGRDYLPLAKCVYYSSPRTMEENTSGFQTAADLKVETYAEPVSSRYLDIVVEGHLEKIVSLSDYAKDRLEEENSWRK